jgi:cyclophilin family peptidyl-prolyl cis-trans isomerase
MRPTKRTRFACAVLATLSIGSTVCASEVVVCTDQGPFTIELYDQQAPLQTANFLRYVEQGFYSGTVFHRVVKGIIVQGGGHDRELKLRAALERVPNESRNGLSNERGTLAAARTSDPDSATSQFFINLADNEQFDATETEPGYSVFGRVTSGLEVLDAIGKLPTAAAGALAADVPEPLVAVSSMAVLDRDVLEAIPEDTRADVIQQRISDAAALNDADGTLEWIGHYRALCAPLDSYVLLMEANAAVIKGDLQRAEYVLADYFAVTDRTHPSYSSAQALARNLAPSVHPEVEQVFADCEIPHVPPLPNGSLDSLELMTERQAGVRDFMAESNLYLDCLSEVIDASAHTDEQRISAVERHNRMVTLMEHLAEEFNQQVRAFKAREE